MRNRALVAIGFVLVAAALAVWWWKKPSRSDSQSAPAATRRGDLPHAPSSEDRSDREPAPAVVIDDDPRGALRLEGQVVDADDHPVAGATVVLGSNPPRTATTEADGGFAF